LGQFQVAKADENNERGDEKHGGDSDKEDGERRNEEREEENDTEEIISPASYVNQLFVWQSFEKRQYKTESWW